MPFLFRFTALAFFSLVFSGPVRAETVPGAQELINQMSEASRQLNYDGVFIYRRGQQLEAMRLIHKSGQFGESERLVSLTGAAREIIRNTEAVTCIFSDDKSVMVEKSRPDKWMGGLPEPIELISQYYSFAVTGEDRMTGRHSWIVNIRPKDGYRYGYRLWIDKDSRLLLKSQLQNKSGALLEQIMFTQLSIVDFIPEELLQPSISGANYTWHRGGAIEKKDGGADHKWQVSWMPEGFALSHHEKQSLSASKGMVDHMVFTDGLAMVSVFIEKNNAPPESASGSSNVGGVNTFVRFADGYQFTAVGEAPEGTVRKMANSIVPLD